MDVGPTELLIVLAVVLLLFGSKKLPELARGMGQASKEFRKGLHLGDDGDETTSSADAAKATPAPTPTPAPAPAPLASTGDDGAALPLADPEAPSPN
jgi:sec-independent protein translocase protein TatA